MPRYIDAEPFDKMCAFMVLPDERPVDAVFRMIYEAPTADVSPVVHGEWVFNQFGEPHCSVCGNYPLQNGDESYALSNYCPHCGADMRGGIDGTVAKTME